MLVGRGAATKESQDAPAGVADLMYHSGGDRNGVPCADVRVFTPGVGGKPAPTKAGLCLRVEQLAELRKLVDMLAAAAAPDGAAPPTPAPAAPTPDGDDEGEMA